MVLATAACSGDDGGGAGDGQPLRLEAMPAAVEAVESALGGPQRFYEVNATPTLVNVFVAGSDGSATAYVYDAVNDALGEPSQPQAASGNTFTWSQVDFDADQVLAPTLEQLPEALPRTFAVTAASETAVQYLVTMESARGGILDVLVAPDGEVLGVSART